MISDGDGWTVRAVITLYWSPGTAAMAPQACLEEAGAEYEMVQVRREGYTVIEPEGYLELQPEGRIPALRDGDLVLHEAAASACTSPTGSPTPASFRRSGRPSAPTPTVGSPTSRTRSRRPTRCGIRPTASSRARRCGRACSAISSRGSTRSSTGSTRSSRTGGRTCSARRSRRPTCTASCSPAGAGTCPKGVDAAGARRALPAACGAAERGRDAREAGHRGRAGGRRLSHFMFWTIVACVSLAFFMMFDSASSIFERRSIAI